MSGSAAPLHFTETRNGLLQLAEQVELHVYRYERVWMTLEEIEAQRTRWRDWMDRERRRRKSLAVRGAVALPPPHSIFSNALNRWAYGQLLRDPLRDLCVVGSLFLDHLVNRWGRQGLVA